MPLKKTVLEGVDWFKNLFFLFIENYEPKFGNVFIVFRTGSLTFSPSMMGVMSPSKLWTG
jgi:hypothetical protein